MAELATICSKNSRRFLWWRWLGQHDWSYMTNRLRWTQSLTSPNIEEDHRSCRLCGRREKAEYKVIFYSYGQWKPELTGAWIPVAAPQPHEQTDKDLNAYLDRMWKETCG